MSKTVLLRTEHLVVVAQDLPTETVFVTFNAMFKLASGDAFWGEEFFRKEGIAAIGVISTRPNWYPAADMHAAIEAINGSTRGRRVVTYGFSQGGYGALKFGRALNASSAIAFSPQFSIDPAVVGDFDRRYVAYHRPELANGAPIALGELCPDNYVYFDKRLAIDAKHTALITSVAAGSQVVPVIVPFLGHESMWIVTEGGMGPAMVKAFCEGPSPDRLRLRALVRSARGRSDTYQRARLMWLLDRKGGGTRLVSNALASVPEGISRSFFGMCLHIATNERPRAQEQLKGLADEVLRTVAPPLWAWRFFRRHRFVEGELRIARILEAGVPPDPLLRLHAVDTYLCHGMQEEASRLLDEVANMEGIEPYGDHVRRYTRQLGVRR